MPKRVKTPLETLLPKESDREELKRYLEDRITSIRSQLSGMWTKRRKYLAQMNDDFSWRQGDKGDTYGGGTRDRWFENNGVNDWGERIFDLQNDSLNIVGGFAEFLSARIVDDSFGTEPFFHLFPEGPMDRPLADAMQKHGEWKIRRSPWRSAALDAIDYACGLGEGVMKINWERQVDVYETRQTVLFDQRTNKPYQTADRQYIYQGDKQIGDVTDENPTGAQPLQVNGVTISAMLFEKAPAEPINVTQVSWEEMEIEQTNITYNNLRASLLHFEDFLCAENEPDIQEADFVGHVIQRRLSYLKEKYQLDADTISKLSTDTYDPKTAEAKPNQDQNEQAENYIRSANPDPLIKLVECYVKLDPIGDGRARRMMVLWAEEQRIIITMDYIANVTPEGIIPIFAHRVFRVKGRWWGRGLYEIYEKGQEFIDRHLNYVAYRNRFHSNPVTFYDDTLLVADEEEGDFEIRPGATYRTKPGYKKEDVIQVLELPDLDERTWQLMQMMIQIIQVRSGVTSAAQGQVSDLPSSSTATGIESILQSASTLARKPMNEMKRDLEKSLLYAIKLIYANMDPEEAFNYFEGDVQQFGTLMSEQVQNIEMNVRLLMTRFRQREALQNSQGGIAIGAQYIQLPEPEKEAQRPMFVQAIKSLGFDNADSIIRKPVQIDPATGQPMGAPAVPGQPGAPALPAPEPRPPTPAEAPVQTPTDVRTLAQQALDDPEATDDHRAAARRVLAANSNQ